MDLQRLISNALLVTREEQNAPRGTESYAPSPEPLEQLGDNSDDNRPPTRPDFNFPTPSPVDNSAVEEEEPFTPEQLYFDTPMVFQNHHRPVDERDYVFFKS